MIVERTEVGAEEEHFADVGAVVYYLRAVEWAVHGFDVVACRPALRKLHERMEREALLIRQRRFLLVASKRKS
jgi:hypothetical protein